MIKSTVFLLLKYFLAVKKKPVGYAILTYHDIVKIDDLRFPDPMIIDYDSFVSQISFLSKEFIILPIDKIVERIKNQLKPDKLYIGITFDDGFLSQFELAAPFLNKMNIPSTFFITTDFADQKVIPAIEKWKLWIKNSNKTISFKYKNINNQYDLHKNSSKIIFFSDILKLLKPGKYSDNQLHCYIKDLFNNRETAQLYMNWDNIIKLNNNSLFTIGGHSVTHSNLLKINDPLNNEIISSKKIISDNLSNSCKYFAYPFGINNTVNSKIFSLLQNSGYKAGFTSFSGLNNKPNSIYEINRIAPLGGENLDNLLIRIFWAKEINTYRKFITK